MKPIRVSTATHSAVSSTSISRRCPEPLDPKGARVRSLCSECGGAVERRRRRLVPGADGGGGAGGTREAHLQPDPTPEVLKTRFHRSEEHTSELQSHLNLVCR